MDLSNLIKDTVNKAARFCGPIFFDDLNRFVDHNRGLNWGGQVLHFKNRQSKRVAIHYGHAVNFPMLADGLNQRIDFVLMLAGSLDQAIGIGEDFFFYELFMQFKKVLVGNWRRKLSLEEDLECEFP